MQGDGEDRYMVPVRTGADKPAQAAPSWLAWLGLAPVSNCAQHYVAGSTLPNSWSRHRLSYPRTPTRVLQSCYDVPINSPAFPKNDTAWLYNPPADDDL
jgi:hypothetical protein